MCRDDRVRGPGWRLKGKSRVTGTAFLPAMVGGRLQAFWKHGVQVWALGSDQVSSSVLAPATQPLPCQSSHSSDGMGELSQGVKSWRRSFL